MKPKLYMVCTLVDTRFKTGMNYRDNCHALISAGVFLSKESAQEAADRFNRRYPVNEYHVRPVEVRS